MAVDLEIPQTFAVRYNPYTQCIETMITREQLVKMTAGIKNETCTLSNESVDMAFKKRDQGFHTASYSDLC